MTHKGFAVSHLPETFTRKPQSEALTNYLNSKYSRYGYKKAGAIEYNPEFTPESGARNYNPERYRWVENITDGLRFVGASHDIIRLDHTGYYADNWQDETVHGEVYQLPTRNGELCFVPAVNDPNNKDCACVDFTSVTDDKEDAASWADSMAERWAESEREYQAKEDAENRLAEIEQEIKEAYAEFRHIAKDIRANCDALKGIVVVRELVKEKWQATKENIRELRSEQRRIEREGIRYY